MVIAIYGLKCTHAITMENKQLKQLSSNNHDEIAVMNHSHKNRLQQLVHKLQIIDIK